MDASSDYITTLGVEWDVVLIAISIKCKMKLHDIAYQGEVNVTVLSVL